MTAKEKIDVAAAKEKIDVAASEALDPHVRKIKDEKYGCGAKGCTKLFHAAEFVHKHLKLKHPELVIELTSKVREELYFQNYRNDENAPGGRPAMWPSVMEKPKRRRPGDRIKDEIGNRRERDNSVNECFDRCENPQSAGDFSRNDGNNPDEPLLDSFDRQGIPVATFPSDIPPPVLMPVPGAGPLGTFVLAPPEVAMWMLRDQGGPSTFEGDRNGIAMPPRLRQDPRPLRSYTDLDAPDDEVTVIDYRSL